MAVSAGDGVVEGRSGVGVPEAVTLGVGRREGSRLGDGVNAPCAVGEGAAVRHVVGVIAASEGLPVGVGRVAGGVGVAEVRNVGDMTG
ncbi:MAG: hypothetical protein R3191_03855 [Anaerolineales bacterium]|nr:hypothetical protein [Anaerolineales bacterium]